MSDLEDLAAVVRARPPDPRSPPPARAGARFGAAMIDVIAIFFASILLGLAIGLVTDLFPNIGHGLAVQVIIWVAAMLYSASEIFPGESLGKWFLGLTITLPDGRVAPRGRLVVRWLIKYAFLLLMGGVLMLEWFIVLYRPSAALTSSTLDALNLAQNGVQLASWCAALLILIGMPGTFFPQRRAMHDWLAGTAVYDQFDLVRKPPPDGRAFEVQQSQTPLPPDLS